MSSPIPGRAVSDLPSLTLANDPVPAANDPVRLRTLTLIRWVAITGQVLALLAALP